MIRQTSVEFEEKEKLEVAMEFKSQHLEKAVDLNEFLNEAHVASSLANWLQSNE